MTAEKTRSLNHDAVAQILEAQLGPGLELVGDLPQGEWSEAFAFRHRGRDLVVRFNPSRASFDIDMMALRFASAELPMPALIAVGDVNGRSFAISERVFGEFLEGLIPEQMQAALPSLFSALDAMRSADTSTTTGSGPWDTSGRGTYACWTDYLLDDESGVPVEHRGRWRAALAASGLGQRAFDIAMSEVSLLTPSCPDFRELVHSDLANRNVFVSSDRIVGVIDWQCAMFGDHLYDLAWLMFWAPWHPGLAAIDWLGRGIEHFRTSGSDLSDADIRLRCYQAHIGLRHLVYNTGRDRADLEATARRTVEVLGEE